MITATDESLLLSLLDRGRLSERKIARIVGVSRGTVRSRKAGYRGRVVKRCSKCGARLTRIPCLICQRRKAARMRGFGGAGLRE